MPPIPSPTCTACRTVLPNASATVYAKTGDIVCLSCFARQQGGDLDERVVDNRTVLIVGSVATFCALAAFAIFVYAFHDEHYVYEGDSTSDASFEVLKIGIFVTLIAAGAGGALANWAVRRRRRASQ